MQPFAQDLIKYVTSITVLTGAIAWIVRSLVAHILSRDVERFKAATQRVSQEYAIQFTTLHQKRIEVLEKIFLLLTKLHQESLMLRVRADVEYKEGIPKNAEEVFGVWSELSYLMETKKLYFSRDLANQIWQLGEQLGEPAANYYLASRNPATRESAVDELIQNLPRNRESIQASLNAIEEEFRRLVGVTPNENSI